MLSKYPATVTPSRVSSEARMTAIDLLEGIHERLWCQPPAGHPAPRVQHSAEIHRQEATDCREAQQNASPVDGHTRLTTEAPLRLSHHWISLFRMIAVLRRLALSGGFSTVHDIVSDSERKCVLVGSLVG